MEDFDAIVKEFHPIFYKISRAYTDNDADFEDLFQEMLIQVWSSYKKFRGDSKLSTWLYRVALNTALSFQKKNRKTRNLEPLQDYPEVESDSETDQQKIDLLYQCIRLLEKDDRSLILLQLEGKSYEESSEILGISTSNVGVKLMRIRKKLEKLLKEQGYGRV
jgi:RNA polymerase sigma-70 factor (ECF subfamily)